MIKSVWKRHTGGPRGPRGPGDPLIKKKKYILDEIIAHRSCVQSDTRCYSRREAVQTYPRSLVSLFIERTKNIFSLIIKQMKSMECKFNQRHNSQSLRDCPFLLLAPKIRCGQ